MASQCALSPFFLTVFSLWFDKPFDKPFDKLMVVSKVERLMVVSKVERLTILSMVEGQPIYLNNYD